MGQYQFCPQCGAKLDIRPGAMRRLARGVGQWRAARTTTLESTALAPWQPEPPVPAAPAGHTMTAIRQTPVRGQNLEADLATPFLQAIATGLFVSILGLYLAWVRQGVLWHHGLIAGVVAAGIYWLLTLSWNRKLLWLVEEIIQADVDGDGYASQPEPKKPVITFEVVDRTGGFNARLFDLPEGVTEADLAELARGALKEHRGLAESSWTGRGKPFSKPKFKELMDVLTEAGLVRWIDNSNHAQGRELTGTGCRNLYPLAYGAHPEHSRGARTHAHAGSGDTLIGKYEVIGEG